VAGSSESSRSLLEGKQGDESSADGAGPYSIQPQTTLPLAVWGCEWVRAHLHHNINTQAYPNLIPKQWVHFNDIFQRFEKQSLNIFGKTDFKNSKKNDIYYINMQYVYNLIY
jgi:hypothetical protein